MVGFPKYGHIWAECMFSAHNDSGNLKPIAYASCTLSKSEGAYAQIECEGLALVFGVRRFTNTCMVTHLY